MSDGGLSVTKPGQIGVLAAQAVERPGADRRPHELEAAGVHLQERLRVVRQVGVHAVDDAQVVGVLGQLGKTSEIHSPDSPCWANLNGEPSSLAPPRSRPTVDRLARLLVQLGLVVEQIDVRRPAVHAQEDDALGPRAGSAVAFGARRSWPPDAASLAAASWARPAKAR